MGFNLEKTLSCSETKVLTGHKGAVNCLVNLPNMELASGSEHDSSRVWDVITGEEKRTLTIGSVDFLVVLPRNELAIGSRDNFIRIFSMINSGSTQLSRILSGHTSRVTCLVVLQSGELGEEC